MYSNKIQKLIDLFSRFPGIGPKVAGRFVFYLAKLTDKEVKELANAILEVKNSLRPCGFCFKLFEPSEAQSNLCEICSDNSRDRTILGVVEKEADLVSIEKNKPHKGIYFILGETPSSFKQENMKSLKVKELKQRIEKAKAFGVAADFKEIILALNPTIGGEAATLYLERELKDLNKKITRLGRGLPSGGELEYADRETILSAFKNRK